MKAAVFYEYGQTDVLTIANVPQPIPKLHEILVQVKAAAINPKDTFIRKGRFKSFTGNGFPKLTGFDFAGTIAAIGTNVTGWHSGDAVYGMVDGWHGATCAEYVAVPAQHLARKPENCTFEEAAAVPLVALTALQALRDEGKIQRGQQVCINGASGGVGTMAIQIAKIYGAQVTTITSADNLDFCRELGADVTLDYRQTNISQHNEKFDIVFDVFGNQSFSAVRPILSENGIYVSTVLKRHVFISQWMTRFFGKQKTRLVVVKPNTADLDFISEWLNTGQLKPIIHSIFALDQIREAHQQQESKHTRGKIVVRIE
jgi:NADPH:quinone reductase-like Zn-dependent oxidoreductase